MPPRLGPRGEGWVVGQAILLLAIVAAGLVPLSRRDGWDDVAIVAAVVGGMMIACGIVVGARGILDLGSNLTPLPHPSTTSRLVEHGVYRHIRHPIYAGIVLASLGWSVLALSVAAAMLSLVLLAWFDLKARREEAWLCERHAGYSAYQARTRKFVPLLY